MAQIDIPAEEDTSGLHRPDASGELDSKTELRDPTGDLVIVPVDASALAAHGLDSDGAPLAASSTADHLDAARTNGALDPAGESASGSVNGTSNGSHHHSVNGSGDSTASSGLSRPRIPDAVPYDMAADEPAEPIVAEAPPVIAADDLLARTPPLRPYIEDPTGPLETGPLDPRTTATLTQLLEVTPAPALQTATPAPTIKPGIRLRRRPRPRVRRVRRVIRSVDTWTVFKVSLVFYLAMYVIFLVASVLIWRVANATGTLDNVQTFLTHYGWDTFQFRGGEIYHAVWIIGLFLVVAGVGLNVTMATLFNLIADLVGGVRVTVLEEEVRLRPRVQITKAVVPHQGPVAPTPGEPVPMPTSPPLVQPDPSDVELAPDFTSDIVWIAPSSSVAPEAAASAAPEADPGIVPESAPADQPS